MKHTTVSAHRDIPDDEGPKQSPLLYSRRIKVADLELSRSIPDFDGLERYVFLQLLLRWRGTAIGYVRVPVRSDRCSAEEISETIYETQSSNLLKELTRLALDADVPESRWNTRSLLEIEPVESVSPLPSISVAVCTRDRTEDLALCLAALRRLVHAPVEILVIDNAPRSDATRKLVESSYPEARYILEDRPGLDWARNRAIGEARGELLAFTDDDVIVDSLWTQSIVRLFGSDPDVMAVTGLVAPYEIETEAQAIFETYGGFGRGFERKWYRAGARERRRLARLHAGSGKFGTGANMAFRRTVFAEIGWFDPALDVGTVTNGGGDLDMFFRVLKHGHTLAYEPSAIVWHRHRRSYSKLKTQITNNGIGFYAHLARNATAYPEERLGVARVAFWWLRSWNLSRWLTAFIRPPSIPRGLIACEVRGSLVGWFRYRKARKDSETVLRNHGQPVYSNEPVAASQDAAIPSKRGIAVRVVEVSPSLAALEDVAGYQATRVFVTRFGAPLGELMIANKGRPISSTRLADEIARSIGLKLILPAGRGSQAFARPVDLVEIRRALNVPAKMAPEHLPEDVPISIVIATCDRPDALRECLKSLQKQNTKRAFETVVVDNRPASGLTPPVVAQFDGTRLIDEARPGLSFARNAGFIASSGEILVCTDDDVTFPPNWLESLLAPFARNDVMLVTGNVFPAQLENQSEIQFEAYGGLGRGFARREYDRKWFDWFRRGPVPTWTIGATANAAVRATALRDPSVGLLDEALGAGTPAGCSEDTYLFYKVLKAGHTVVYEPSSYVWHKHRATEKELHNQILSYAKGHAAYNLTTWMRDGDARGLFRVCFQIPKYQCLQLWRWLRRDRSRTLNTIILEIRGNATAAFALWRSRRRLKRLGRSAPCLPPQASSRRECSGPEKPSDKNDWVPSN